MSNLEQALVAAASAFLQVMNSAAQAPVQPQAVPPSYPPPGQVPPQAAPQPQYQAPPQAPPVYNQAPPTAQAPMPTQPFQQPPAATQGQYPFADNIGAQNWTTDAWDKAVAINQDQAQAEFGALMAQLGTADFNHIGPDKFPILYNGVMAIKAKMGIQG